MLNARTRALLDRYALASRALSRMVGERSATEPGQSVEFHDYRPYQPGDELRYVDWRVYARTGRLYTRLYQAERAVKLHLVFDTSPSMSLNGKGAYARTIMRLLTYVAQRDAPTQLHVLGGPSSRPAQGFGGLMASWRFIDAAGATSGAAALPVTGLKEFALKLPPVHGSGLVLVVSDLLEDAPLRDALAALRARRVDVGFLQVVSPAELDPKAALLELVDIETGERLPVGHEEVEAYKQEVRTFLARTRSAVLKAGFKHTLLSVAGEGENVERAALGTLLKTGIMTKR